jgi:AcrR family transcriptional regulator
MTGIRTEREEQGEVSRQRILDAAVRLMSARGYDGTSISAIVAEAGLPASSIYWHFGSKEGVLLAAIERERSALLQRGDPELRDELSPRDRFIDQQRRILRSELNVGSFSRLALMLGLDYGGAPVAVREALDRLFETGRARLAEQLVEAFADRGTDASRRLAAELVDITWATMIGLQLSSMLDREVSCDERVEAALGVVLELGDCA